MACPRYPRTQESAGRRRCQKSDLQLHHQAIGAGCGRQSPRTRSTLDRRLHGAARARLSGRFQFVAGAVAQAAGQPLGRPRPVGGAAPDLRTRGRDRGLQDPRILDGRHRFRHRQESRTESPPHSSRRPQAREIRPRYRRASRDCQARDRAPRLLGGVDRPPPGAPQPTAALHHLDPAAGGFPQARRRRRDGDAYRPAPL